MLQKIIERYITRRHYWRTMSFDELSEIYTSMTLRSLGFSIIGIFIPVFLYKSGVPIDQIFLFFVFFFVFRLPVDYASAFLVGRIGPKHALGVSTLLHIFFLFMLLSFESMGWPLWSLALFFSMSNGLFFIAYHTDFSKIKDSKHGGKELSYLLIFERIGGALGPLIGGLLATFVSPEATIIVAILILLVSQVPLFLSKEPVRVHQHITFKGFHWRKYKADYLSLGAFNIDKVASVVAWPFLISLVVFTEGTYAKLGTLITVTTLISIFVARLFGRIIDNKRGWELLKFGTWMNAIVHLIRPFVLTPGGVIGIGVVNEPVTLAYNMPLAKAFYDRSDTIEGYRIVYISFMEMVLAVFKGLYWFALFGLSQVFDPVTVLTYSFIVVAFLSTATLLQQFPALKKV